MPHRKSNLCAAYWRTQSHFHRTACELGTTHPRWGTPTFWVWGPLTTSWTERGKTFCMSAMNVARTICVSHCMPTSVLLEHLAVWAAKFLVQQNAVEKRSSALRLCFRVCTWGRIVFDQFVVEFWTECNLCARASRWASSDDFLNAELVIEIFEHLLEQSDKSCLG